MKLITYLAFFLGTTFSQGAVIFSGTDGTLDIDAASGTVAQGGISVTLSANDGTVNATTSGLGINDSGSGDTTSALDTTNLTEILTLSFNQDIVFNSIAISGVGTDDALEFNLNGGFAQTFSASGSYLINQILLAGQTITLTALAPNAPIANNGVSITQFTVTPVPEPGTAVLAALSALGLLRRRR